MLNINQLADFDAAKLDIQNKQMILSTAIDIQALLRMFVDKGMLTKEEINQYREEVRKSPKYHTAMLYVEQTLAEIQAYEKDPQLRLRTMFDLKMQGK